MNNNNNNNQQSYEDLKCIWMSSNLVEYKLCDRNFECENCPFDKVMRNLSSVDEQSVPDIKSFFRIENVIDRIKKEKYESRMIYLKNHLRMKHLFGNTYSLGLDPLALMLLDSIEESVKVNELGYLQKGGRFIEVKGKWGNFTFDSPFELLVLNRRNLLPQDLYDNQWLAIVGVIDKAEVDTSSLNKTQWDSYRDNMANELQKHQVNPMIVGATMQDGGELVKYLYQYFGTEGYNKILFQLLKQKSEKEEQL